MATRSRKFSLERLGRLRRLRRVRTMLTLGVVLLGPVLALATYLILGPLGEGSNTPALRLILLADLVYVQRCGVCRAYDQCRP